MTEPTERQPRRRTDLISTALPDGLFVFDPVQVRAHALNPSAAMVWERCDGTRTIEEISRAIRDELGSSRTPGAVDDPADDDRGDDAGDDDEPPLLPRELTGDIALAVAHLTHEGLLDGDRDGGENQDDRSHGAGAAGVAGSGQFPNVPHLDQAAPDEHDRDRWPVRSPTYRGLDLRFRISGTDAELGAYLDLVLAPLRDDTPGHRDDRCDRGRRDDDNNNHDENDDKDDDVAHYTVVANHEAAGIGASRGSLALDGHLVADRLSDPMLAATLLWHVNQLVSTTAHRHLLLHASAVQIDGVIAAFPASMNSGKSTLGAALVRAGHPYVTDETVAIDPDSLTVDPYPKAIALDPGSWPVLPDLEPALPAALERFGRTKWYIDARAFSPMAAPGPLGLVVFPRHVPGAPPRLERLGPTRAAVELAQNSFNLLRLGEAGIDAIGHIASTIPCYRLDVDDLDTAIATIRRLVP